MKKIASLLFVSVMLVAFAGSAFAEKVVKVTSMETPKPLGNVPAGTPTPFTFWIKNTGTEALVATDSIFYAWASWNGSSWVLHTPIYYTFRTSGMPVGDSFTVTLNLTINGTPPLQFSLAFFACVNSRNLAGISATFNLSSGSGIDGDAVAIEKSWYTHGNLNVELQPKANCEATLTVYNLNGQMIGTKQLDLKADSPFSESYNFGEIPQGVYIMNVQTPYGVYSKKFLVQ